MMAGGLALASVTAAPDMMMHVWTVDHPGGPFAEHLDKTYLKELIDSGWAVSGAR